MNQKVKHLINKGLSSVKENGVKQTCFKVLNYCIRNNKIQMTDLLNEQDCEEYDDNLNFNKIKFSILVPLYNTPELFLREMIESVQKQTYENWELCLADGSDAAHDNVGEICRHYFKQDMRIKYRKLEHNSGISGNSNAALQMAEGNYIALFDHDDLLHPNALMEVAKRIEKQKADFIYTDEAVFVSSLDNIISVHRKPDYAPDNLRANNYICHFTVFAKKLLEKTEAFRSEYDGSQDHDLILRLTSVAENIVHIPKILYYWRSHAESVASGIGAKSYAVKAGQNAVKNYLESIGEPCTVESLDFCPTIYRIRYKLKEKPLVSIAVFMEHVNDLNCIDRIIEKTGYTNYEIVIMLKNDTQKTDFINIVKQGVPVRYIIVSKKETVSSCMNKHVSAFAGKYIVVFHPALEPKNADWIEEMLMYAQRNDVGIVGSKIYFRNNTIKYAKVNVAANKKIVEFPYRYNPDMEQGYMGKLYYAQDVSAVASDCVMFKKELFMMLNGFEEQYQTDMMSVIDFCVRAGKQNYLVVWTAYAEFHSALKKHEMIQKTVQFKQDKKMFQTKYAADIPVNDPYYII